MEAVQAHAWIRPQDLSCHCQETTSEMLVAMWQCRETPYPLTGFVWSLCRELKYCMVAGFSVANERLLEKDLRSFLHIPSCRHGNRPGCELDQWPTGVTRSRPHCFGTKLGRECTQSPRLFGASGSVLDADAQLRAVKLQTGDCLTLQVGTMRIVTMRFAAILRDGSVVTWGSAARGGDSSSVPAEGRATDPSLR